MVSKLNVYLTIPITIILLLFNKFILGIFGSEFIQGSETLKIILAANAISVLCGPVAIYMNMTNLQNTLRNIMVVCLVISLILAVYLIPILGIKGGAISYATFVILWNIAGAFFIKIKTGIRLFFWPMSLLTSNE